MRVVEEGNRGEGPCWLSDPASYFVLTFEATVFRFAYTAEKP